MALEISKTDVWACEIVDQTGGLAAKLGPLSAAGVDLSFLIARRQSDRPGAGVAFIGGLKGAKQTKAATAAGFAKSDSLAALRVDGPNRAGAVSGIAAALASSGINLRGVSATTIGKRFAVILAFDSAADAATAAKAIKRVK